MILSADKFNRIDYNITQWMAKYGITFLRVSIGIIFLWFGALKFFAGASPAEALAIDTITTLTFGLINETTIILLLAILEVVIGIGLIFNIKMRAILLLLGLQMFGTFTPIALFPELVFSQFPYALTLEGQYIIKNLIIVSAAIVIGATVRGGKLVNKK